MDKISTLKPIVRKKAKMLVAACQEKGISLIVTSAFRSFEEQNELYAQGRTKPGNIVTNAKAGESFHNWRVAFDVVGLKNGIPDWNCDWKTIGELGEALDLEWGGRWTGFVDKPHFQYTGGHSLKDFQNGIVDESIFADGPPPPAPEPIVEPVIEPTKPLEETVNSSSPSSEGVPTQPSFITSNYPVVIETKPKKDFGLLKIFKYLFEILVSLKGRIKR
jgi:peptidoglycan LD-endopeptidase CwlK